MRLKKWKPKSRAGDEFFASAEKSRSKNFVLFWRKGEGKGEKSTVMVVAPKKNFPKAVERSAIKRKVFSILKDGELRQKVDDAKSEMVFVVHRGASALEQEGLRVEMVKLLESFK